MVSYTDHLVPRLSLGGNILESQPMETAARQADCVVIVADHSAVDYERLVRDSRLIVDTRNRLRGFAAPHIIRL